MTKMKIIHLIDHYQPEMGYQETYLARRQCELGHQVHVVTSGRYAKTVRTVYGKSETKLGIYNDNGIIIHRLPCFFELGSRTLLMNLRSTLRKIQPDVIHCHEVFSFTAVMAALLKKQMMFRLIYDTHAADFNTKFGENMAKRAYYSFFRNVLAPLIKRNADAIIAIGEDERKVICREFKLKSDTVKIIPLGADLEIFGPNSEVRKKVREQYGIKQDDALLIHAGKLIPTKDVDVLLKAVIPLMNQNCSLKLLIVGTGEESYLDKLKCMTNEGNVSQQVIFHDFVDKKRLAGLYNAADIGVWPGDPTITILEAMAVGLPIVILDHPTTEGYLANNNGFSVPKNDAEQLVSCLSWLLENLGSRKNMGRNSRELIVGKYNWDTIAEQFLQQYGNI